MSERRGNQAAHLQVLASIKSCFCQKRKQVSFTTHRAQIPAEYGGEAARLTNNTQKSDMTKVLSICTVQQGLLQEDNLFEQLEESVYLQTKPPQCDFSNCLYTRLFSLEPAFVKGKT